MKMEEFPRVPWKVRDVFLSILFAFLAAMAISAIVIFVAKIPPTEHKNYLSMSTPQGRFVMFSYEALLVLFAGFFIYKRMKAESVYPAIWFDVQSIKKDLRYAWKIFLFSILILIGLALVIVIIIVAASLLMRTDTTKALEAYSQGKMQETHQVMGTQPLNPFGMVFIVFLAPIFEEIFYRGFFYSALRKKYSVKWAIVISGITFGLLHGYIFNLLNILILGFVTAYLYEKRRTLTSPCALHIFWNSMAYAFGLVK